MKHKFKVGDRVVNVFSLNEINIKNEVSFQKECAQDPDKIGTVIEIGGFKKGIISNKRVKFSEPLAYWIKYDSGYESRCSQDWLIKLDPPGDVLKNILKS